MAAFLKEWWQTCHRENNYYISDFGGPELWQWMGIRPQAGDRVLAIGVGGGEDCRQLAAIGAGSLRSWTSPLSPWSESAASPTGYFRIRWSCRPARMTWRFRTWLPST